MTRDVSRRTALALVGAAAARPAFAFPPEPVDDRWLAADQGVTVMVDHAPWADFLAAWRVMGPDGIALVRYGEVTTRNRDALRRYLDVLGAVPVARLGRDGQFAFWANLYNALTVKTVLAAWPVGSIRDIGGSLFAPGPWRVPRVRVDGVDLSLDDIEHGILRPIWRDPRIHYAVNCASLGCPDLPERPFEPPGLEAELDAAAVAYVNHPRGARFDNRGGLVVSSIYRWYEDDFGGGDDGVIAHLRRFALPELSSRLGATDRIDGDDYDWAINDGTGLP